MARIRSVKPEFWTAEQVMECSPIARLLFIGMWNFCDDAGNHPASVKTLKAEVFPADDLMSSDIESMVADLVANGLIEEYEAQGKAYWHVTGWHHQKIDQPTYKYPMPDGTIPEGAPKRRAASQSSTGVRRTVSEQYSNTSGMLIDGSPPEGSGEESTGVDRSKPISVKSEEVGEPVLGHGAAASTRKGLVCGLLRKAGMADSAPHYLTEDAWEAILAKRTDEEIVELARAKMAANPGRRIGLKYIAPALLEDPQRIEANARDSPAGRRKTLTETRTATIAGLTGGRTTTPKEQQRESIESTAVRIAG